MSRYYLAVDIGASGGRHILGFLENGKIRLEEVYRFSNGMDHKNGRWIWNTERILEEILCGMRKCKDLGKIPTSMSIDTWGVDYVLLDKNNQKTGDAIGYRDSRTQNMDRIVEKVLTPQQLYARTGIPKYYYNTIYQLTACRESDPEQLERADTLLMTPDYYQFLLTGIKAQEYTMATTTQLVSLATGNWDYELIRILGLPAGIFQQIREPGSRLGSLLPEIRAKAGFDCDVILGASHDTASAVMAIPSTKENKIFISSGTWSIIGVESKTPLTSEAAMKAGFTNEGSYGSGFYFAKNIMGLWMIQSVMKEIGGNMSYGEICTLASKERAESFLDCTDIAFLAPESMKDAVKTACNKTGQPVPETLPEIACVIYNSLAKCYADAVTEIESLTGKQYDEIHIIGGGSQAEYLNQLTEKYTGKKVIAGPAEATAIGNIMVQMISNGIFESLSEARECVAESF